MDIFCRDLVKTLQTKVLGFVRIKRTETSTFCNSLYNLISIIVFYYTYGKQKV